MDELVSIIMPAYNAEKYLEETILSVIEQTYINWELIIVNDGSVDSTQEIAKEYQSRDSRIKVISQANTGQGGARNAAMKIAQGSWLAFLDADDLWIPTKLEQQLALRTQQPDVDVFFSAGWKFEDTVDNADEYKIINGRFDPVQLYKLEYQNNYIPVLSVIAKKTATDKVGLMDEGRHIQNCEDWDYWLRLALSGAVFYGMSDHLFYYRRHAANNSGDSVKLGLAQAAVWAKNYRPHLLTERETKAAFIPLINALIIALVKMGRKQETTQLVNTIADILPKYAKMYRLLLNAMNIYTIGAFYFGNRVYLKLNKWLGSTKGIKING